MHLEIEYPVRQPRATTTAREDGMTVGKTMEPHGKGPQIEGGTPCIA